MFIWLAQKSESPQRSRRTSAEDFELPRFARRRDPSVGSGLKWDAHSHSGLSVRSPREQGPRIVAFKRLCANSSFAPSGLAHVHFFQPRLTSWAAFFRRFAAALSEVLTPALSLKSNSLTPIQKHSGTACAESLTGIELGSMVSAIAPGVLCAEEDWQSRRGVCHLQASDHQGPTSVSAPALGSRGAHGVLRKARAGRQQTKLTDDCTARSGVFEPDEHKMYRCSC